MMGNKNHIYHILIGNNQYLYPIPIGNNLHYLSSVLNITSSFRCPQNLLPISSTKSQARERLLQMIELAKEWFLGDRIVHHDMCRRSWLVGDYRTYTTLYYPILVGGLEHEFYDFPFSWECHHPNWRSPSKMAMIQPEWGEETAPQWWCKHQGCWICHQKWGSRHQT